MIRFTGVIENAGGGGAYVKVPFDVERTFGSKRPKVKATIDGVSYRGTLVRMGAEYHILGLLKEIRTKIGKSFGDSVEVQLEPDAEPRIVDPPPDLKQAFRGTPGAKAAFDRLAYSRQREYVNYIVDARKPETRARRIAKVIAALKQSKAGG